MNENFVNGEQYKILMENVEKANDAMQELAESFGASMNDLVKSLQDISSKYGVVEEKTESEIFLEKVLAFKKQFDPELPFIGYSIFFSESFNKYEYMKTSCPMETKFTTEYMAAKCCRWLNGTTQIEDLANDSDKDRLKLAEDIIGLIHHIIINNTKIEVGTKDGHRVYGTMLLFDEDEFNKIKQFLQIKEEE